MQDTYKAFGSPVLTCSTCADGNVSYSVTGKDNICHVRIKCEVCGANVSVIRETAASDKSDINEYRLVKDAATLWNECNRKTKRAGRSKKTERS